VVVLEKVWSCRFLADRRQALLLPGKAICNRAGNLLDRLYYYLTIFTAD